MKIDIKQLSQSAFKETEFFICVFDPENSIELDLVDNQDFDIYHENNFFIISSKSNAAEGSLISRYEGHCILFRGYDLDLSIHSYSNDADKAVLLQGSDVNNGVYTYLNYNSKLNELSVKSDPFGVSPLYMRTVGSTVFFSTHPSLIKLDNDKPDLMSFLSLIQNGFIFGDRSFYQDIKRVSAGTKINVSSTAIEIHNWFNFSELPKGNKNITEQSFVDVEQACQSSINKCLKLKQKQVLLPFSSGFDSRRFFAYFQKKKVKFKAVTAQSFHMKNGKLYDIDAPFATIIAKSFGVDTTIVSATKPEDLAKDFTKRNTLIGSETFMHSWSIPLINWLIKEPPSLIFDGLSGDTFGNGGFEFPGLHQSAEKDIEIALKEMVNNDIFSHLNATWPSAEEYKEAFREEMNKIPSSLNQIELVFLQFRSRRAISPWITMMHPPGHVVVFPYYDLNFVNICLAHNPKDKLAVFFQKECLKRFWPEYYEFQGSRNLPKDFHSLGEVMTKQIDSAKKEWLKNSTKLENELLSMISMKNYLLRKLPVLNQKRSWLFEPLSQLLKFDEESLPIIKNIK